MVDNHQQELEEETRVEASQAYNILVNLQEEGKITPEKAELYKQKFYVLHEACIKNMQNERKLSEKISQLKKVSPLDPPIFMPLTGLILILLGSVERNAPPRKGRAAEDGSRVQAAHDGGEARRGEEGHFDHRRAQQLALNAGRPARESKAGAGDGVRAG